MIHRCGKCGSFVSLRRRWWEGQTSWPLILCKKCWSILLMPFEWILEATNE